MTLNQKSSLAFAPAIDSTNARLHEPPKCETPNKNCFTSDFAPDGELPSDTQPPTEEEGKQAKTADQYHVADDATEKKESVGKSGKMDHSEELDQKSKLFADALATIEAMKEQAKMKTASETASATRIAELEGQVTTLTAEKDRYGKYIKRILVEAATCAAEKEKSITKVKGDNSRFAAEVKKLRGKLLLKDAKAAKLVAAEKKHTEFKIWVNKADKRAHEIEIEELNSRLDSARTTTTKVAAFVLEISDLKTEMAAVKTSRDQLTTDLANVTRENAEIKKRTADVGKFNTQLFSQLYSQRAKDTTEISALKQEMAELKTAKKTDRPQ